MKKYIPWIVILLVVVAFFWVSATAKKEKVEKETRLSSRDTAMLCTADMATEYHIHPELTIVIDGVTQPIPADIGIEPTCMKSIHTHTADGVIHVESPIAKEFTLGDFFAVWQKDFSKDKILDKAVTAKTEIVVTVNGQKVDTYENTILRDKDKIVISYQNK